MRRSLILAAAVLAGAFAGVSTLMAQDTPSVSRPASTFKFGPTGVKTSVGELMASPAYGDLSKGPHGTFIRMPAGFVSPVHTHTDDYFGVVIEGVGGNTQDGKNDVELPAGSYWFQKGKEPHVTKCTSKTDCLFLIFQQGKFDYVPVK